MYYLLDHTIIIIIRSALHPIIVNRIGLDLFFNRIKRFKDSSDFSNASRYLLSDDAWGLWEKWFLEANNNGKKGSSTTSPEVRH